MTDYEHVTSRTGAVHLVIVGERKTMCSLDTTRTKTWKPGGESVTCTRCMRAKDSQDLHDARAEARRKSCYKCGHRFVNDETVYESSWREMRVKGTKVTWVKIQRYRCETCRDKEAVDDGY